jgi:hypothetical protein
MNERAQDVDVRRRVNRNKNALLTTGAMTHQNARITRSITRHDELWL